MRINADLQPLVKPIDGITIDPANARAHSPRNLQAIKASLTQFGQQKAIVVNREGVVLAGNGTVEAALSMGATEIAATVFDGDSRTFERAYAIADNRSAELADWDFPVLSDQLRALIDDNYDLASLGWENHETDVLLKATWTPPGEDNLPGTTQRGQHGVRPVLISQDQREAFEKACDIIRTEYNEPEASEPFCFGIIVTAFLEGKIV